MAREQRKPKCRVDKHLDVHKTGTANGRDRDGRPWHTDFWKCYSCGLEWSETRGPGVDK
jgi:hypothetical protein